MGRRSGDGGGGGAWNDFQRAHGGHGLSRGEMLAMYHVTSSSSSSSPGVTGYATHATRTTSAWNECQHDYGGRGLSTQDIQSQYAHEKGKAPASVATNGLAKAWNEFQHDYAGTGLSRQQVAHLYSAQNPLQHAPISSSTPTQAKPKQDPSRFHRLESPFTSPFRLPTPSQAHHQAPAQPFSFSDAHSEAGSATAQMAPANPYHIALPFAMPFSAWGLANQSATTAAPVAPAVPAIADLQCQELHLETIVYLPFSVDSHGHDRSPEELAFKYYRRRHAKAKSVASVKAIFAAACKSNRVEEKSSPQFSVKATRPCFPSKDKQKLALSTVNEGDEEEYGESRVRGSEPTAESQPMKKEDLAETNTEQTSVEDVKAEAFTAGGSKQTNDAKPQQPERAAEACELSLVFSDSESALLGKGTTGPTVAATIAGKSTQVAVKIVPSVFSKRTIARIEMEAQTLMKLPRHRHVAQFNGLAWLEGGTKTGVASELLPHSENLMTRLYASKSPVCMRETSKHLLILQLLDAVDHLHAHNITHRDLNPTHVLVSDGQGSQSLSLQLIGFGLPTLKNAAAVAIATTGTTGFHAAYAAPELLGGQLARDQIAAWQKSDIYSVTVVLMELLLEEQPWEGELPVFFIKAVAERGERPFDVDELRLNGRKSRVLKGIVAQAWHQDPERRPTASVLREMLAKVFGVGTQDAKTSPQGNRC